MLSLPHAVMYHSVTSIVSGSVFVKFLYRFIVADLCCVSVSVSSYVGRLQNFCCLTESLNVLSI